MAIPGFGFLKIEALACQLMVAAGLGGLLVAFTGSPQWITSVAWSKWILPHVSVFWLVAQSLAVMAGGIGARLSSFVLAAFGIAASLIVLTPVGCISFLPGVFLSLLIACRFRAFRIFLPRWRGPGRPPPDGWRP